MENEELTYQCNQDLHIHTVFSVGDSVVSEEQTLDLIYKIKHAKIIGISDHFEYIGLEKYEEYKKGVLAYNFKIGTEVGGKEFVKEAAMLDFDYYLYHCFDRNNDYKGIDTLLNTGKPVIIAHPQMTDTRLSKIPPECYLEINNRYIFKYDWYNFYKDYKDKFNFIISSDAHQPHWLNQNAARYVADQLGIKETILFPDQIISDVANS
jgi:histidinol phosphatase-like PHP family hydrolase